MAQRKKHDKTGLVYVVASKVDGKLRLVSRLDKVTSAIYVTYISKAAATKYCAHCNSNRIDTPYQLLTISNYIGALVDEGDHYDFVDWFNAGNAG